MEVMIPCQPPLKLDHIYVVPSHETFDELIELGVRNPSLLIHKTVISGSQSWEGVYFKSSDGVYIEFCRPDNELGRYRMGLALSQYGQENYSIRQLHLMDTGQEYIPRYDKDGAPWFEALSFDHFETSPFYIWLMEYKGVYKKTDDRRHPLQTISQIVIEHNQDLTKQCQNLQWKYQIPLQRQTQSYAFTFPTQRNETTLILKESHFHRCCLEMKKHTNILLTPFQGVNVCMKIEKDIISLTLNV